MSASQSANDGSVYNVADSYERNPEIIRAEMALLNTPATQVYSAEAYTAIKNVQQQCAADYKNMCAPVSQQVYTLNIPDIFSHLNMVFGHRALTKTQETNFESQGAKLVKTLQSYYKPSAVKSNSVVKSHKLEHKIWTTSNSHNNLRAGGRRLKSKGKKTEPVATVSKEFKPEAEPAEVDVEALPPKPQVGRSESHVVGNVRLSPGPMMKKSDQLNLEPKALSKVKEIENSGRQAVHNADGQLSPMQGQKQQQNMPPLRGAAAPGPHGAPGQLFQQGEVNGRGPPPRPNDNGPPPRFNGNGPPPRPNDPRSGPPPRPEGNGPPPRPNDPRANGPPPRPNGNGPPPRPNDGNGPPPRPGGRDDNGPPPRPGGNGPPPRPGGKDDNGPPPRPGGNGPPPRPGGKDDNGPPPRPGGNGPPPRPGGKDDKDGEGPPRPGGDHHGEKPKDPAHTDESKDDEKEGEKGGEGDVKDDKKAAEKKDESAVSAAETTEAVAPKAELTQGAGGRPNGFVPGLAKDTSAVDTAAVAATVPKADRDLFMINGRLSALAKNANPTPVHIVGNAIPMFDEQSDVVSSDAALVPHQGLGGFMGVWKLMKGDLMSDSGSDSDSDGENDSRSRPKDGKKGHSAGVISSPPQHLDHYGAWSSLAVPADKQAPPMLHSMDWGHGHDHHDDDADDHHKGRGPPEGPPHAPPPPHDGPPRGPHGEHGPPPPPPGEDVFYSGALGYGAQGDMCMYENLNQLSDPCVQSMSDLYRLRDEYWHETAPPPPHGHCMVGAFLVLGLVAVVGVRKYMQHARIKKVRNFLSVIHANPELKATVEAETGMKVPEIRCGGLRSRSSQPTEVGTVNEDKPKYSCCARLGLGILWFGSLFMLSFYLAVSSLEDTGRIIQYLDSRPVEDGAAPQDDVNAPPANERHGVTVPGALTILLLVCIIKVAFTCMIIKGLGCAYNYFKGRSNNNNSQPPASAVGDGYEPLPSPTDGPSAPPSSPVHKTKATTTRYTAVNVAAAPLSTNTLVVPSNVPRIWGRWSTPSASSGFFSARRTNGYSPVDSHDQDTEMTTVSPTVVHAQQGQQQQYVLVPVTATPVSGSGFSMV